MCALTDLEITITVTFLLYNALRSHPYIPHRRVEATHLQSRSVETTVPLSQSWGLILSQRLEELQCAHKKL